MEVTHNLVWWNSLLLLTADNRVVSGIILGIQTLPKWQKMYWRFRLLAARFHYFWVYRHMAVQSVES
jgi:hypothetical protein